MSKPRRVAVAVVAVFLIAVIAVPPDAAPPPLDGVLQGCRHTGAEVLKVVAAHSIALWLHQHMPWILAGVAASWLAASRTTRDHKRFVIIFACILLSLLFAVLVMPR